MLESLRTAIEQRVSREFVSDIFDPEEPLSPEEELEQRRSELRNGLTESERAARITRGILGTGFPEHPLVEVKRQMGAS